VNELHQKKLLLNSILENTQAQTRAIEGDELELLESLISQRQGLMSQVDELDQKMETITMPAVSKEEWGRLKDLLGRIITIDKANQDLMKKSVKSAGDEVEGIKEELRRMRERRRQEESYAPEYGSYREEGVFFDKRE